jgi:hypothetical protein
MDESLLRTVGSCHDRVAMSIDGQFELETFENSENHGSS